MFVFVFLGPIGARSWNSTHLMRAGGAETGKPERCLS